MLKEVAAWTKVVVMIDTVYEFIADKILVWIV